MINLNSLNYFTNYLLRTLTKILLGLTSIELLLITLDALIHFLYYNFIILFLIVYYFFF